MKTKSSIRSVLIAGAAVMLTIIALPARADYGHDDKGYFDKNHHHHPFVYHHHHRGYWDSSSGTRVFITV